MLKDELGGGWGETESRMLTHCNFNRSLGGYQSCERSVMLPSYMID
jgi:hypothetical protein